MKIKKIKKTEIILIISVLLFCFYYFFSPLPSLKKLKNQDYSYKIQDNCGEILYISSTKDGSRREYTELKEIPDYVQKAFIKAEDKRFYFHIGIDFISIFRAAFQDISQKRRVSGASTITMQLSRLASSPKKRTFFNKILEADRALKFEGRLSKKKILELYLNSIPFGNNVQGVTSAARYYFSKDIKDITREEACILAVIPRRPKDYNPHEFPEKVSLKACELFNLPYEKLLSAAKNAKKYQWPFKAEHLVQRVIQEREEIIKEGKRHNNHKNKDSVIKIKNPSSFYNISLTVNAALQDFCSYNLREKVESAKKSRIHNAAAIVLDNSSSEILCYIGNTDWADRENSGNIDGITVKNQMGSSMKPFLYAAAIENRKKGVTESDFSPYMILDDLPMEFGNESIYLPRNFNNRNTGPVLFRQSLASSLNIPAVYLLSKIGVDYYLKVLEELGFYSLKENGSQADLGLSLGAGEVTLYELARAFSVFPRDGILSDFTFYKEKEKKRLSCDKKINEKNLNKRVFEKDTARIICDILSDKSSRSRGFGYSQTFETKYPSIFKTGTANQYQSIVALGASPDYTVAVWMGNFSGNTVVGKTGSSLPALCAKEILDFLKFDFQEYNISNNSKNIEENSLDENVNEKDFSSKAFLIPENYEKIPICPLSGMYPGENCPVSLMEYAEKDKIEEIQKKKCSWHKKDSNGKLLTIYPSRYQSWLSEKRENSLIDYFSYPLEISSPANDSIFYLNEITKDKQKIPVEVTGGISEKNNLLVFYDGIDLRKILPDIKLSRPFTFFLPVERGLHSLRVILGEEEDQICFEVK